MTPAHLAWGGGEPAGLCHHLHLVQLPHQPQLATHHGLRGLMGMFTVRGKGLEPRGCWPTAWPRPGARPVSPPSLPRLPPRPGIVRASSVFPILSTILLLLGGLCIGAGRFYSRKNNIVLSAGILFVAAGEPPALVPAAQSPLPAGGGEAGRTGRTVAVRA